MPSKVAHYCSTRVMNENLPCSTTASIKCGTDYRKMPDMGRGGSCAEDMIKHCPRLGLPDTTECIKTKQQLSRTCVDSSPIGRWRKDSRSSGRHGRRCKGNPGDRGGIADLLAAMTTKNKGRRGRTLPCQHGYYEAQSQVRVDDEEANSEL